MKNNIIYLLIVASFLVSCWDFVPADDYFIQADPTEELPFEKLVGKYELDKDSKKRYNILDSINLTLEIEKDSAYTAFNYINPKNGALVYGKIKDTFDYTNDYRDKQPNLYLYSYKLNKGGVIDIYYRKKDRAITLYVLTPFVPATKENNMQYKESDYLRYIKIK